MPIISIHKAAEELGDSSVITDNPKRTGNKWWERVRLRELRLKAGLPLDPTDPMTHFPAVRIGGRWKVDTEALQNWRRRWLWVA